MVLCYRLSVKQYNISLHFWQIMTLYFLFIFYLKYYAWYCFIVREKAGAWRPHWNLPRLIPALGYLCWRRFCDSPGTSLWVFYMSQSMSIELNLHSIRNIPFKSHDWHVKDKCFTHIVFPFLSLQLNMLKLGPTVWCQYYMIKPQWRKKNFMK